MVFGAAEHDLSLAERLCQSSRSWARIRRRHSDFRSIAGGFLQTTDPGLLLPEVFARRWQTP